MSKKTLEQKAKRRKKTKARTRHLRAVAAGNEKKIAKSIAEEAVTTLRKERTYQVSGDVVQTKFKTLVVHCPHVDEKTNKRCPGILTTTKQERGRDRDEGKLRITYDPKACEVFEGGGTVALICGACGSLLEARKSAIVTPQQASKIKVVR